MIPDIHRRAQMAMYVDSRRPPRFNLIARTIQADRRSQMPRRSTSRPVRGSAAPQKLRSRRRTLDAAEELGVEHDSGYSRRLSDHLRSLPLLSGTRGEFEVAIPLTRAVATRRTRQVDPFDDVGQAIQNRRTRRARSVSRTSCGLQSAVRATEGIQR